MPLKKPESVEECIYFTRRQLEPKGSIMAWAFRKECPQCHNGLMKKPKKTSKVYICPNCGYEEDVKAHEESLVINVEYVCPYCGHEGEATTEYKRKTWKGVKAYVFTCEQCKEKIGITKKMKDPKKSKKKKI